MAKPIKLSEPKKIEYWARIGKLADENPGLPLGFVRDTIIDYQQSRESLWL